MTHKIQTQKKHAKAPTAIDSHSLSSSIDTRVNEAIEHLESEARRIEMDTRFAIQEKSKRWANASAGFLLLALGLLTFFGFKEVVDFDRKLSELGAKAEKETSTVLRKVAAAEESLDKASASFALRLEELEKSEKLLSQSQRVFDDTKALAREYDIANTQVNTTLKEIAVLQNSFFNITIMYHGSNKQRQSNLQTLVAALRAAGYTVLPGNIIDSTVNRTELLYYDESVPSQVKQVHTLMEQHAPAHDQSDIIARFIPNRNNSRELLIKLRVE
jgi:hypothetical protein